MISQLGCDEPTFSMDPSGKPVYTKNQEVLLANVQTLQDDTTPEGTHIPISIKEMGSTEISTTLLIHSPNGCFVTVIGDGEYIIYTMLVWHNKSFRNGVSFTWNNNLNMHTVLENHIKLRSLQVTPFDHLLDGTEPSDGSI